MAHNRDRAAIATTTIVAILTEAWRSWLRGEDVSFAAVRNQVEKSLRDEFADCAREARAEHKLIDD